VLLENELALCIADADPVTPGRSLVILRRRVADGLALHQTEWNAVMEQLKLRREQLGAQDASISGWAGLLNARGGLNSGEAAGQPVFHAHWHLIPRRTGDDKSPRGGVRGGYQAQTALLSGGLPFGRAESQQGLLPGGPPETTKLHTLRGDREACRTRTCEGHC
jgi:diadenosine tetraphosphate (Ap4A) HIT family hydrolase